MMTQKIRVIGLDQQRGGLNQTACGDKNYKAVEYETGFFHRGGLIAGSTQNFAHKSSSTGKTVDFYTGLKLDGPLNPGSKNYETVCREQEYHGEIGDVKHLRQWERNILVDVDAKYDPDYDSSDEEAIRVRKERADKKAAQELADAEAKAAANPRKK
jgi:hypothetical protein